MNSKSFSEITLKRALLIASCLKILSHELEQDLSKLKEENVTEVDGEMDLTKELEVLSSLLSCLGGQIIYQYYDIFCYFTSL